MTSKPLAAGLPHPPDEEQVDDLSIQYSSSDGEPMAESDLQFVPLVQTVYTLRTWFAGRPDAYIAGDMLVYYKMNDNTVRVAPDVFAVFGASGNHPRDSWLVWREGNPPDLVMEIASTGTWQRDVAEKRDIYVAMGVVEYWRFDPTGVCFTPALAAERLVDGEYLPMAVSEESSGLLRGRSEVLGLDFCVEPGLQLRVYDPATGERLGNHQEETEARRVAEANYRRETEARRVAEANYRREAEARQAAEEEIRHLRDQLRQQQSRDSLLD